MSQKINPSPFGSFSLPSEPLESQPPAPLSRRQTSEPLERQSFIQPWQDMGTPRLPSQPPESSSVSTPPFYYRRQDSQPVERGPFVQQWQEIDTPPFPSQPPKSQSAVSAPLGSYHSEPHAWQDIDLDYVAPPPEPDLPEMKEKAVEEAVKPRPVKRSRSIVRVDAPFSGVSVSPEKHGFKLELSQSSSDSQPMASSDALKRKADDLGGAEETPPAKRSRPIVLKVPAPVVSVLSASERHGIKLELSQSADSLRKSSSDVRKRKLDVLVEEGKARPAKRPRVSLVDAALPLIPAQGSTPEIKSELPQSFPLAVVPIEMLSPLDQKLFRTFKKSIAEHGLDESKLPDFSMKDQEEPFALHFKSIALKGIRTRMEDAHFHIPIAGGFLFGIFDGHNDKGEDAAMASREVQRLFPLLLKKYPLDLKKIIREICAFIHKKITRLYGGTTALFGFVDSHNRLTVGRVGDSKLIVIRKVGDEFYWFPITRKRDWTDPKPEQRAIEAYPELATLWHPEKELEGEPNPYDDPKQRRVPPEKGINTEGSLGDIGIKGLKRTPDVTLFQLEEGDFIFGGCDGVFDFVTPDELIQKFFKPLWGKKGLLQDIANYILDVKKGTDNLTIVSALVESRSAELSVESSSFESTEDFGAGSD